MPGDLLEARPPDAGKALHEADEPFDRPHIDPAPADEGVEGEDEAAAALVVALEFLAPETEHLVGIADRTVAIGARVQPIFGVVHDPLDRNFDERPGRGLE